MERIMETETPESLAPELVYGAGVRGTRGVGQLRQPEQAETEEQTYQESVAETEDTEQAVYDLLKDYIDAALSSADQNTLEAVQEQPEEEDVLITYGSDIAVVMLLGMIFGLTLWGAFSRRFFA